MTELTKKQREDLEDRLDNILEQLKERPYDLVLIAGLTYTAGLLEKHDIILEHCAELFYNEPTNTAFLRSYTQMMAQNISDGRYDLVIKHKKKFEDLEDYFVDYFKEFEMICNNQAEESDKESCENQLKETLILYEELVEILENPSLHSTNNTPPEPL